MAKYAVSVRQDDQSEGVVIQETDDLNEVLALHAAVLPAPGNVSFSLSVAVAGGTPPSPPPPPPATPAATQTAQTAPQGGSGKKGAQTHWAPGHEPK